MAKRTAVAQTVDDISEAVPHLIRLPERKARIDYDEEADVLYISGRKKRQIQSFWRIKAFCSATATRIWLVLPYWMLPGRGKKRRGKNSPRSF